MTTAMLTRLRASAVCVADGELLCVRMRDPSSRVARLFVPGGGIDEGELAHLAAERETWEETGYRVEVDAAAELVVRYPFEWDGREIACTTHFFRAQLRSAKWPVPQVRDADYNEGTVWIPLAALSAELGFHRAIHDAVRALALGSS